MTTIEGHNEVGTKCFFCIQEGFPFRKGNWGKVNTMGKVALHLSVIGYI